MTREFAEYVRIIRAGIASGEIRLTEELTDFDLAVQYAISKIGKRLGYPYKVTLSDIAAEIRKFAPELVTEDDE